MGQTAGSLAPHPDSEFHPVPSSADTSKPKILVVVGPTCSGKTAISLVLASKLDGEVISADSRQIYKYLDIGTAKPTPDELRVTKHHFVNELLPDQVFNAGEFGERGRGVIQDILRCHKLPIVVGGAGLYIRSLIDGFFEGPGADMEFRNAMEGYIRAGEIGFLVDALRKVDPESAATIDSTKPRRLVRALEVHHLTGTALSALHRKKRVEIEFHPVLFGLNWNRKELYRRIEDRCEQMIHGGLLLEVEHLERMGYNTTLNALNTVGYAEAFAYRRGELSFDEFARLFKQHSRQYAKRQLTWFRRDDRITWIEMSKGKSSVEAADEISVEFQRAAR